MCAFCDLPIFSKDHVTPKALCQAPNSYSVCDHLLKIVLGVGSQAGSPAFHANQEDVIEKNIKIGIPRFPSKTTELARCFINAVRTLMEGTQVLRKFSWSRNNTTTHSLLVSRHTCILLFVYIYIYETKNSRLSSSTLCHVLHVNDCLHFFNSLLNTNQSLHACSTLFTISHMQRSCFASNRNIWTEVNC